MRIIFLRHGETKWNKESVIRGTEDVPLTPLGRQQAIAVRVALEKETLESVYASSLSRTYETAEIVVKGRGLPLETRDFLYDMNFGQWEGIPVQEAADRWPQEYLVWREAPHLFQAPGGDSMAEVWKRVTTEFQNFLREKEGTQGTILLVSHRVIIKLIILWIVGVNASSFWRMNIDNCSISSFQFNEGSRWSEKINDTCHLPGSVFRHRLNR